MSISEQLTGLRTAISNALGAIDGKLRNKPDRGEIYTRDYLSNGENTLGAGASRAGRLTTPRAISLGGDGQGSVSFDGSGDVTLTLTVPALADKANAADTLTSEQVDARIQALIGSAPEALDTLKELADALGNNPNFATTVQQQLGEKATKSRVDALEQTLAGGFADLADAFRDGITQINSTTGA
ncbi:hypothetical protein [Salinicola sp. RZ23]|uniref:hypothetical protein n=1 Tax=Salinicola sp. RZ23 TaxID=1949087 RepID=UPI000DA1B99D|nr:hypothetical protein [Salinicola sp. RZ23]